MTCEREGGFRVSDVATYKTYESRKVGEELKRRGGEVKGQKGVSWRVGRGKRWLDSRKRGIRDRGSERLPKRRHEEH